MGSAYKNRKKEIMGRPGVVGYETVIFGKADASAVAAHTAMTDAFGITQYTAPRNGYIEYIIVDSSAISSGQLDFSVSHGGTVLASGSFDSSTGTNFERVFSFETDNELAITSGNVFQAAYAVPTEIGALGVAGTADIVVRAGLKYREF